MPTTDALDLAPDTSTGEISDCPPPPDGATLVGALDDIADAATDPTAIAPAAAAILLWYLLRRRKLAAKPQGK